MLNEQLARLNFEVLVLYEGGAPKAAFKYNVHCSGLCTSCEEQHLLTGTPWELYQMSHAADTSDYEHALDEDLPAPGPGQRYITEPVMFLLWGPSYFLVQK